MKIQNPVTTFEGLKKILEKYIQIEELTQIEKVYEFAKEKYVGLKRLSGEEFITHALQVAAILGEIHADSSTICAALLHGTMKDCQIEKEELAKLFNEEIATLVEGITKINKLSFSGDTDAMVANQRKILVGMTEDVRVIILKLADRLQDMRTLWALSEKEQKENAKETLDIYTPIAHRLGINSIKGELEDLSLRYSKPDVYYQIVEKLNKTKTERDQYIVEMKETVSKLLNEHNIKHEIKGRSKSIYSIYKKLDKGKSFQEIYDLLALRVFVNTEEECYQTLGIIHSKFKPIPKRFKDYIAMPKTNMYQSLHTTVFGIDGQLFEIQIRTYDMDKVAENGIASHWSYKEGKSNMQSEMEQKLQFFRVIMELKNEGTEEEFMNSVREDVLKDSIYVFTPQGDVIELPKGSTPIDFAYRVHSKIGDTMVGAIVNNNIVSLDYELQDNDIIKINTNKNSTGPSREWLNIAKTAQARSKIRSFFHKTQKEDYTNKGEDALMKELRKRKLSISTFLSNDNVDKILTELKCQDLNELYIYIGNGKFTPTQVINVVTEENTTKEELILRKTQNKEVILPNIKNDVIVEGIDDIKVNIASCCKPIYGDDIIGYITKGNGITIHRSNCPNIEDLEERFIDVHWNELIHKKYPASLLIRAIDNRNILLEIIAKTSNSDNTIESINTINSNDDYLYEVTILVSDKEKLEKYMHDLEMVPTIHSVERLIK